MAGITSRGSKGKINIHTITAQEDRPRAIVKREGWGCKEIRIKKQQGFSIGADITIVCTEGASCCVAVYAPLSVFVGDAEEVAKG